MRHPSTLAFHRYRYGELEPADAAELKLHAVQCAVCAARLSNQQNHRAAFEMTPMPEALRRVGNKTGFFGGLRWMVPTLLTTALLLFAILPPERGGPGLEVNRVKGMGQHAEVWHESAEGAEQIFDDEIVFPGDNLQFRYRGPYEYISFAGIDGSGTIEIYETLQVDPHQSGWAPAPFGITLDTVPGSQDLFVVFSQTPQTSRQITRVITADLADPSVHVEKIHLVKSTK